MQRGVLLLVSDLPIPVYKVGAVIVRQDVPVPQLLIIQPKPKFEGEVAPFVLPRGSRQYWVAQDSAREYHDIRDAETARAHADQLEPVTATLAREIEEEAGVTPAMLAASRVVEMGPMDFTSRTKGTYAVHWFIVVPHVPAALGQALPVDAVAVLWASMAQIEAMIARGTFSAGYLPVITRALALVTSP